MFCEGFPGNIEKNRWISEEERGRRLLQTESDLVRYDTGEPRDKREELSAVGTRVVGKTKTSIGGREVLARRVEDGVKKRSHVSLMMRNDHLRQCTSGRHDFGHRTSNDSWRVRDFGPLRHPRVFSELCPFHLWWTRPLFQVHRILVPVVRVPLRLTH